jgi:toxin secretion/phage lysis holin
MEHIKEVKLAISSVFATIFYLIGWQGLLFILLAIALVIDYITGSIAARQSDTWTSAKASAGRRKKAMIFVAIIVAIILDAIIWIGGSVNPIFELPFEWPFLFTLVSVIWFILSEVGSTLENLILMNVSLPVFLTKGIKILKAKAESVGDHLLNDNNDE